MLTIDRRASQMTLADLAHDVRAAIEALEATGLWRPIDLLPEIGAVRPLAAQINPDSVVFSVSGPSTWS